MYIPHVQNQSSVGGEYWYSSKGTQATADRWYPTHYNTVAQNASNILQSTGSYEDFFTSGTALGGNTKSTSNLPPYLAVYMWKRIE
jgi:hypothetical protein